MGEHGRYTFPDAPLRVYWEMTRACALACHHCRASAMHERHPGELDTAAGHRLIEDLAAAREPPHLVLTGGDPLERHDTWDLIAHARGLGVPVSFSPAATERLTPAVFSQLAALGVTAVSVSLDGSTPEVHDRLRQVAGCFERTIEAVKSAVGAGLSVQVNTLVTAATVDDIEAVARVVVELGAHRWSLFFLVPMGRGVELQLPTVEQAQRVFEWLVEQDGTLPFDVSTTEAPQYRVVALRRGKRPRGLGMGDANGVMFVSHVGEVYPSGFLPLLAGDVRESSPIDIYRNSPIFRGLRDRERLEGRCGRCEYRHVCGGSRARAYALTGNPFAEEALCSYEPGRTASAGRLEVP